MLAEVTTHEIRLRQLGRQIKLNRLRRNVLRPPAAQRERRRDYRMRTDWPLRFRAAGSRSGVNARISDISDRGMFIRTAHLVDPGTVIAGAYQTAHGVVGFRGRVAWVYKHPNEAKRGFGVTFTRMGTHTII